jgi:hypothetical protein
MKGGRRDAGRVVSKRSKCYLVGRWRLGRRDGELAGVEVPRPVPAAARAVGAGERLRRRRWLLREPPRADAPHGGQSGKTENPRRGWRCGSPWACRGWRGKLVGSSSSIRGAGGEAAAEGRVGWWGRRFEAATELERRRTEEIGREGNDSGLGVGRLVLALAGLLLFLPFHGAVACGVSPPVCMSVREVCPVPSPSVSMDGRRRPRQPLTRSSHALVSLSSSLSPSFFSELLNTS